MAGNATQIRAGKAFVELGANDDKLRAALKKAKERLEQWGKAISGVGKSLMGIGAAAIGGIGALGVEFGAAAVNAGKLSARTGIALDQVQSLAGAVGGPDALEHAIFHMNKAINESAQGSPEATAALTLLGVTSQELSGMLPDQQFLRLADAIAAVKNPAQLSTLASSEFGRSVLEMLPVLKLGRAGIEALQKRWAQHHQTFTNEDLMIGKRFGLAMGDLTGDLQRVGFAIGKAILPYLEQLLDRIVPFIDNIVLLAEKSGDWVVALFQISGGVVAAGAAIYALGSAFSYLSVVAGVARVILSLALNPLVLLPALAVGGIGAVLYFAGAFDDAMGTVQESWGGVVDAIRAGDLGLAWKIVISGLKTVWLGFRNWWMDTVEAFGTVFWWVGSKIERGWDIVTTSLREAWIRTWQFLGLWSRAGGDAEIANLERMRVAWDKNADANSMLLTKQNQAKQTAREKELADAHDELHGLTQKAAKEAAAAKAPKPGMLPPPTPGPPPPPGMHGESVGSFSAAAASGLGLGASSNYLAVTASATQATAANTATIAANVANLGTVA